MRRVRAETGWERSQPPVRGSGPAGAPSRGQPVGKESAVLMRLLISAPDSVSTPLLL